MLDETTEKNVNLWLESDVDTSSKSEIRKLLADNPKEIIDAFYTRLSFGTGGLRGLMGVGTNRMNRYTVRMATQGLANYLAKQPKSSTPHSVFIGYDSRHNSRQFAEEAAKVLAGNGIKVYLCNELRPTPLVSFGCRYKGCSAAIMITASHNPSEYNGYKVYWSDGGQVVPPHDKGIIQEVNGITDLSQVKSVADLGDDLITPVGEDIDKPYFEAIRGYQLYPEENQTYGHELKVVYTSLHGTGITLVPKALKEWGFTNLAFVEPQIIADGDFPTVKSPNPEERKALQLGIEVMEAQNADLLVATDPDADRVGIAIRHQGETVLLNGNQVACICLYHICEALQKQNRMPKKAGFIKTIPTTELFRAIAESYGAACFDVLTGFKYIAALIHEWELDGGRYEYVFGGEESYGYLLGTHARDKDAVISTALICEVALHAKRQGRTLLDLLHEIYKKFGVYFEKLLSIKFEESKEGKELAAQGMANLRQNPPKEILGVEVEAIEDYQNSLKLYPKTGVTEPLEQPVSDVVLFWLADGSKLIVRPSGTEPKVKIYCGVREKSVQDVPATLEACEKRAEALLDAVKKMF